MNEPTEYPTHDDIAALAQKIWDEEGQPEGRAEEHWQRAEAELRQFRQVVEHTQSQAA